MADFVYVHYCIMCFIFWDNVKVGGYMVILNFKDYEEMSVASATLMEETLQQKKDSNICLASGDSPKRTYQLFVEKLKDLDYSNMMLTKLDEWCDIHSDSPMSCEKYLRERVLSLLDFNDKNFISFQSDATNYEDECMRIHSALETKPIDLCVLGLGKNGHLGLNEPNAFLQPFAHVAKLSDITKTHTMIEDCDLQRGLTIGMAEIMASKKILLQISGTGKQFIYKEFLSGKLNTQLPASFLWMHPNVVVYVCEDKFKSAIE